jgi:hypothetical protein
MAEVDVIGAAEAIVRAAAAPPARYDWDHAPPVISRAAHRPCAFCGHPLITHLHHRAGTDCGSCDCPSFVARQSRLGRLLDRLVP